MNQKTGKLLRKYATQAGKPRKEIRRWWEQLNWKERTKARRRIEQELPK